MAAAHTEAEGQQLFEEALPDTQPHWDPNSGAGQAHLDAYHLQLLVGLNRAAKKPVNLSKTTEVLQGPNGAPSLFLERLQDTFRTYPSFDPEAPESGFCLLISP